MTPTRGFVDILYQLADDSQSTLPLALLGKTYCPSVAVSECTYGPSHIPAPA